MVKLSYFINNMNLQLGSETDILGRKHVFII